MDHLPVPQNPVRPNIDVPYLCQFPYDGKGFKDFPQRCGFELDDKGCVRPKGSDRAMLGFYQTWLYFGLIMEFFRYPVENGDLAPIKMEDFIRPSDAGSSLVICSVKLTDMINIWSWNYYGFKMPFARKPSPTIESLRDSVEHALLECVYLDHVHVVGTWQIEGAYEIILSIKVLLNSFLTALGCQRDIMIWDDCQINIKPWDYGLCYVPPSGTLLERHMINHSWCPFRLHHTFASFPYNTIYYLACLPKTGRRIADHTHCLEAKMCKGDSINDETFRCQHTSACDGMCPARAPPMEKVKSFLNEGGIPLITCSRVSPDGLALDVVKATKGVKYTAISHVWADGLGNTLDNSMPDCQLRRLFKFLETLQTSESENSWLHLSKLSSIVGSCLPPGKQGVIFWMDVLCIPVGNENKHLKTSAIARMTPTYNGAENVLMLDSDLLETSSNGTHVVEIYARVVKSAWKGRYWTLQEGLLAPKLFVQTQDRAFRIAVKPRFPPSRKIYYYDHEAIVASVCDATYRDAVGYGFNNLPQYRDEQFMQVWNDLLGRSTTKFEDVHCIVANLLDFKAAEILRLPPNSRMKAMLCAQKRLPLDLICGQSPRIESDDGSDSWVPAYPGGFPIEWNIWHNSRNSDFFRAIANKGLRYLPSDRVKVIWLDVGVPRLPRFCVETEEEKWWIHTYTDHVVPVVNESINYPTCLIMDARNGDVRSHGYCGPGARLSIARLDHSIHGIRAKFDCSFSFGLWSWGQTDPSFKDVPVVTGRQLPRQPILIETEILEQYKQLTRRRLNAKNGPLPFFLFAGLTKLCSIPLIIVGLSHLVDVCTHLHDSSPAMVITACLLTFGPVLLFLAVIMMQKWYYNKWRMSFADEQTSTERQNHWFPQFSRYIRFSWWKKLRQGPWNALRRRRYTAIPEDPLEPIQSYFDEPPGPST